MRYLKTPHKKLQLFLLFLDVFTIAVFLAIGFQYYPKTFSPTFVGVWAFLFLIVGYVIGIYDLVKGPAKPPSVIKAAFTAAIAVLGSLPLLAGSPADRLVLGASLALASTTYLVLTRRLSQRFLWVRQRGETLICLQSDAAMRRLEEIRDILSKHYNYNVIVFENEANPQTLVKVREPIDRRPNMVVYEPVPVLLNKLGEELVRAQVERVPVVDFINLYSSFTGRLPLDLISHGWLVQNYRSSEGKVIYQRWRRALDVGISLVLLGLFLVPMALIALAIRLETAGPAILRQERLGQFRKPFSVIKFRTMVADAESEGPQWAQASDSRITWVGAVLRKFRLDELPQIINILKGEMSLIGPRPIRQYFADQLSAALSRYDMRFLVKPGVTGWSQVLGPYGSTVDEHRVKLELDLYYIYHANVALDLYILMKTIQVVARGAGR